MLKKLSYGVAFLWVAWVSVSVIAVTKAKSASAPAWTGHPNASKIEQPTVMSKHELVSEDHTADVVAIEQVWNLYSWYTDTDNGPGMASIFTPDGVFQHLYNDGHGKFLPSFGIVAPGDSGKTPEGQPIGSGCVLKGRDEIAQYKRMGRVNPLPWPGHSHHEMPSTLVKVSDDGQTAVMTTPSIQPGTDAKGVGHLNTNGYRAFFKKTSEGWEMAELYDVLDYPSITDKCDATGNLPRVFTPTVPQP
jgi:hypothetical protein